MREGAGGPCFVRSFRKMEDSFFGMLHNDPCSQYDFWEENSLKLCRWNILDQ